MPNLLLAPQAIQDLEEIFEYTLETWGFNQAEKYHDELFEAIVRITENPRVGSTYYFKKR